MAVRIGIDIGSSTTKIVAFEGEHMLPPMAVKADSQVMWKVSISPAWEANMWRKRYTIVRPIR